MDKLKLIEIIGTKLFDIFEKARAAGKSREEAEREAARAVERGEVVSDELYDRFDDYIDDTKKFEEEG